MTYQGNIFRELPHRRTDAEFMALISALRKAEREVISNRAVSRADPTQPRYAGSPTLIGARNQAYHNVLEYAKNHPIPGITVIS